MELVPIRVFLVEDNQALREEMSFQLEHEGFEVRSAQDARELASLLQSDSCDVLVLDVNLPGEDGFSIARRLAAQKKWGIVMLTARDEIDDKLRALRDGADIYLVKPIDRRELAACIVALARRVRPTQGVDSEWCYLKVPRVLQAPDNRELSLTPQDAIVLGVLLERQGETCTRAELGTSLGIDFMDFPEGRINTVISRLRAKLIAFDPNLRIVGWRNQGYAYVGPLVKLLPTGPSGGRSSDSGQS